MFEYHDSTIFNFNIYVLWNSFFYKCLTYNSVAFQIVNIWNFTLVENYCIDLQNMISTFQIDSININN